MSKNHWRNIQSSLLRFCSDFAMSVEDEGFNLSVVNLDAFTDEAHWPEEDFIGLGEFNTDFDETYMVQCVIGLSIANDTNLFRTGKLTHELLECVLPNSQIRVYHADTGEVLGSLFVQLGGRVGAPLPTKAHPLQPVMLRLASDLASI